MNLNFNAMRGTICTVGGAAFDDIARLTGRAASHDSRSIAKLADDVPSSGSAYLGESNSWVDDLGSATTRGGGGLDDAGRGLDELGNPSRSGGYDEVGYGGDSFGDVLF
ncbi:MAG: hypothetical protein H7287_05995 [Thermoleophilia bacterium]|nr:hypothetical protein [Thermoleophilia bacterium]